VAAQSVGRRLEREKPNRLFSGYRLIVGGTAGRLGIGGKGRRGKKGGSERGRRIAGRRGGVPKWDGTISYDVKLRLSEGLEGVIQIARPDAWSTVRHGGMHSGHGP